MQILEVGPDKGQQTSGFSERSNVFVSSLQTVGLRAWPPRHAHGDLTSLAPHERLPDRVGLALG